MVVVQLVVRRRYGCAASRAVGRYAAARIGRCVGQSHGGGGGRGGGIGRQVNLTAQDSSFAAAVLAQPAQDRSLTQGDLKRREKYTLNTVFMTSYVAKAWQDF